MRGFATMHVRHYSLDMCTVNDEIRREAAGGRGAAHALRRRRTHARPPASAAAGRGSPASARPAEQGSTGAAPRCASATLVRRSGERRGLTVDVDPSGHVRHGTLAPVGRRPPCSGTREELPRRRFDFSDHLIESIKPDPRVLARLIADEFQDKDVIIIDCAPTESIFTRAAYHASRYVLVPVKPEFFATIGFPLLNDSLGTFRKENRGHRIDVIGVLINNSTYHYSGNRGGPERKRAMDEIKEEAARNGWHMFENEIPLSRGFPKMMRGDFSHLGDAPLFYHFAREFFGKLGFEEG